jgi:hypothetical protein
MKLRARRRQHYVLGEEPTTRVAPQDAPSREDLHPTEPVVSRIADPTDRQDALTG